MGGAACAARALVLDMPRSAAAHQPCAPPRPLPVVPCSNTWRAAVRRGCWGRGQGGGVRWEPKRGGASSVGPAQLPACTNPRGRLLPPLYTRRPVRPGPERGEGLHRPHSLLCVLHGVLCVLWWRCCCRAQRMQHMAATLPPAHLSLHLRRWLSWRPPGHKELHTAAITCVIAMPLHAGKPVLPAQRPDAAALAEAGLGVGGAAAFECPGPNSRPRSTSAAPHI